MIRTPRWIGEYKGKDHAWNFPGGHGKAIWRGVLDLKNGWASRFKPFGGEGEPAPAWGVKATPTCSSYHLLQTEPKVLRPAII